MVKKENFKIYGADGSTAQRYANDNNFEFIEIKSVSSEDGIKIEYTNDIKKLYPKVREVSSEEKFKQYLNEGNIGSGKLDFSYSLEEIGRYKRKEWSFQKEWRYIYSVMPMGLKESNPPTTEKQIELIRRIENREYEPAYSRMFLDLDDSALESIEVLCGPRMSDAEKIIVKALLKEYCPNGEYKESRIKIKK